MKKLFILVISASFLFGCTHRSYENNVNINTVKEKLDFNVVDESVAKKKVENFISNTLKKNSESYFVFEYRPKYAALLEQLKIFTESKGVKRNKIETIAVSGEDAKDFSITVKYTILQEKDCGRINISNKDKYRFGCALEYNRNLSLVNPLAPVE